MTQNSRLTTRIKAGGAAALVMGIVGLAGFGLRSGMPLLARETPRCAYLYQDTDMNGVYTPGVDEDVSADHEHFGLVVTGPDESVVYQGRVDGCHLPTGSANTRLALTMVYGSDHALDRPVHFVQIPASVHDAAPVIFLMRENFRR